jgi:L-lysine 6-transaminase
MAAGLGEEPGKVLHFRHAFHGRTGYTLSLTNTADPRKTQYFPRFDWPRVSSPAMTFPMTGTNLEATIAAERQTLKEIDEVYAREGESKIACILIEPIQCEGGDRHFRKEFMAELRKIADERDALLIFDEVQTGFGASGTMWQYEQIGVTPDLVAFSKKSQTGGIMAGPRLDDVDSVFRVKSRISSTFGGNLVDYVRCQRVLEIMEEDKLLENVRTQGRWLLEAIEALVARHPKLSNPRGVGLLLAFDAPDGKAREAIITAAAKERLIVLPCGDRSVRMRPALDVTRAEAELAMQRIETAVKAAL